MTMCSGTNRVGLALIVVLAGAVSGCAMFGGARTATFAGEAGPELSRAKSALMAGDAAEAEQHLQATVSSGQSAEAHYYLALIKKDEDPDAALEHVRDSLQIYPSAQGFLLKGALLQDRNPKEALQSYQMGLDRAGADSELAGLLHRNAAVVLARQGHWQQAHSHMRQYVEIGRERGRALGDEDRALWGLCLYQAGKEREAEQAWDGIRSEQLHEKIRTAIGQANLRLTRSE